MCSSLALTDGGRARCCERDARGAARLTLPGVMGLTAGDWGRDLSRAAAAGSTLAAAAQAMGARPIHARAAEIQGQLGLGGRHSAAAICAMARQELGMPEAPENLRLVDKD